ncbi:MAG: nucleoside triphosphate pyrophosphohydrolase [Proteobacteria bacterium]|nr:nucleoside triphosphate pyrophosphohydrolase [Pseudomonadota bacterium]MBU2261615.1 nucleoside triphosphate pyrophosphohydrolase [Pseudomonadota bacterium]
MQTSASQADVKFRELLDIIARLRGPGGCPWDRSQKKEDVGAYLIEEAYEVLEALDGASPDELKEELGDLLFQILFLARLAEEAGEFDMEEVLGAIGEKMIRRHPHVFGDAAVKNAAEVRVNWERIKKELENKDPKRSAIFAGIPRSLSTLAKAQRMTARASKVGFDWKDAAGVLKKMEEELAEFKAAMAVGNRNQMKEEAGDLLFTLVNLCRFAQVDAEAALRRSLNKFSQRFSDMERELAARGKTPAGSSLAEMDLIWNTVKDASPKR